jgi:hypothetical protein
MPKNIEKEYEHDFYAWTQHNVKLLREGKISEIDIKNITEEIESMGKSEKRELLSRLIVLIAHLLKWKFQSNRRSKSWTLTIRNQRIELSDLLEESPSLKKELEDKFTYAYERAVLIASEQTGIDENIFPKNPPFTLKDCFKSAYFPD